MDEREPTPHRRATDAGLVARTVFVGSKFWDFVDERDIDKHLTAIIICVFFLWAAVDITRWGYAFATNWLEAAKAGKAISGMEVAAVIAAILGPWGIIASAVIPTTINFYFKART